VFWQGISREIEERQMQQAILEVSIATIVEKAIIQASKVQPRLKLTKQLAVSIGEYAETYITGNSLTVTPRLPFSQPP
jgi:hypothetical protein